MRETEQHDTRPTKEESISNALLTREEIVQFKELAFREYGVALTDKEAYIHSIALIIIFGTLLEIYFAFRCLIGTNTKR